MTRLKNILIALDQLLNALLGGSPDETLSSRAHRARVLPRHGLAVRNVIRHVAGDAVRVRFVFHDAHSHALLADSGWHDVRSSQTLAGPDVARALFPALGVVRASQCHITYSRARLEPVVTRLPSTQGEQA